MNVPFFWQIVMEYCGGGSVADLMNITEEPLGESQIAYICREALKVRNCVGHLFEAGHSLERTRSIADSSCLL